LPENEEEEYERLKKLLAENEIAVGDEEEAEAEAEDEEVEE
jgi:hypothetical protein